MMNDGYNFDEKTLSDAFAKEEKAGTFKEEKAGTRKNTSSRKDDGSEFIPSKLWANIGYEVIDKEGNKVQVTLARGVPLDQLPDLKVGGDPNSSWAALQSARNQLRDDAVALAESIPENSDVEVNLKVWIRHAGSEVEIRPEDNQYRRTTPLVVVPKKKISKKEVKES